MKNLDELTIGQAKELALLFGSNSNGNDIRKAFVGKYVICRSRNEGVNAGKVLEADNTGVVLEDARRLYYHEPLDEKQSWYEGVASSGLSSNSRISCASLKVISEDYSLTACSKEAEESIRNAPENRKN